MRALLLALLLPISWSCRSRSTTAEGAGSFTTIATRQALFGELRHQGARSIFADSVPIDEKRVQFARLPSAVVPGLIYHWAMYRPPQISHAYYRAVVGERGGRFELLRDPSDWGVVTRGWRPSNPGDAVLACLELVNTLTDLAPRPAPTRLADDLAWVDRIPRTIEPGVRSRVAHALRSTPEASHQTGYIAWEVKTWVAQASPTTAARRYSCQLPAEPQAGPGVVQLAAADSIGPSLIPVP